MKMVSCKVMTIANNDNSKPGGVGSHYGVTGVYCGWQGLQVLRGQRGVGV